MKINKLNILIFGLLFIFSLSYYVLNRPGFTPNKEKVVINWPKPKLKPVKTKFNLSISSYMTAKVKDIDFLTKVSDLIVIGKIEKISDYRVNPLVNNKKFAMVYRDIAIVIEQVLKGAHSKPFVTVRTYGDDMKEKAVVDNFSKGIVIPELE